MAREGLMDDTGWHGFDEPDCYGNCANCNNRDCGWYDDWLDEEEEEE